MPNEPAPDLRALADKFRASLTEQERQTMAAQVKAVSKEPHREQSAQPLPRVPHRSDPSGIAERYRCLYEEKGSQAKTSGMVTRVERSSRAELGELKAPETPVINRPEKGGRER
jgi:hypothetical protein